MAAGAQTMVRQQTKSLPRHIGESLSNAGGLGERFGLKGLPYSPVFGEIHHESDRPLPRSPGFGD